MVVIMISISLILDKWQPPIPKGQQGLICICIGAILGYVFYGQTIDGVINGLLSSSIAFWRGDLFKLLSEVRDDATDMAVGNKEVDKNGSK